MTQPQYAPQQPQMPGYPPPQQQYAPAPPQGYVPPPMGYPAQQYPAQQAGYPMPPQGYAPPQQAGYPQQPPAPVHQGPPPTLDAFYSQPAAGGGAAFKFANVGDQFLGVVNREITHGDVEPQTDPVTKQPQYFRDGREKLVMKVPLNAAPGPERADGRGQWYCRGAARDELARAMAAAGAPAGPPEPGSMVHVVKTGSRPAGAGMSPAATYQVTYWRPDQARDLAAQYGIEYPALTPVAAAPQPPAATLPPQGPPVVQYQPPAPPVAAQQAMPPAPPVAAQQAMPPAPPVPQQQAAPQVPQQGMPQVPAGLPPMAPENAALLAQLTGQQLPPAPVAG